MRDTTQQDHLLGYLAGLAVAIGLKRRSKAHRSLDTASDLIGWAQVVALGMCVGLMFASGV